VMASDIGKLREVWKHETYHFTQWLRDNIDVLNEGRRACRIRYTSTAGSWRSPEESWPKIQDDIIDAMVRLERALKPHIAKLKETP
jgi:hypothetical protein